MCVHIAKLLGPILFQYLASAFVKIQSNIDGRLEISAYVDDVVYRLGSDLLRAP